MDEFYVVLPSNNTTSDGNIPSKYITTFDEPIYLDSAGQWEVGLIELNFKNSIKTIHDDYAIITKMFYGNENIPVNIESEFSYKNTLMLTGFLKPIYDKNFVSKSYGWTAVEVEESSKIIFSKDEAHDKYFSFTLQDNKVVLKNLFEYNITMTIPKLLAMTFGFIKYEFNETTKKVNVDDWLNENHTFKSMKPNEEITSIEPIFLNTYRDLPNKKFIIIYPRNFDKLKFSLAFEHYKGRIEKKMEIEEGTYMSAKKLEEELNKDPFIKSVFCFNYDEKLNRFDLLSHYAHSSLKMYNGLNDVLGFKNREFTYCPKPYKGEFEVSLMRGINNIFVYCDCCEYVRVGNTQAPLLRSVSFNSKIYGETVHLNYINPMYIKVNKTFIDKIEIMLCDAAGSIIPFSEGLTIVILHFKRA